MKGKKLLVSALTMAMLCTAAVGGTLLVANADDTVTFDNFVTWDNAAGTYLNGTEDGKSVITTTGGWGRTLLYVSNVSSDMSIEMNLTPDAETEAHLVVFDYSVEKQYIVKDETIEADTATDVTIELTQIGESTSFCLAFYFDTGTPGTEKHITINSLTVGGVSYTPATYTPPSTEVPVPDGVEFKAYSDWTATNATVAANTLEKLPDTDPQYATAVDNGAGKITLTDASAPATIEIPLTKGVEAWPTAWTHLHVKLKATGISTVKGHIEEEAAEDKNLFTNDLLGDTAVAWNSSRVKSSTEGYYVVTINLHDYFTTYFENYEEQPITKLVLITTPESGATAAELDIAGMAFGGATAPVFINDSAFVPELEIGDLTAGNNGSYTIEKNGSLKVDEVTYKGVKVTYTADQVPSNALLAAAVTGFDKTVYTKLYISFYADSDILLGVYAGWTDCLLWHTTYTAGYNVVELDTAVINATGGAFDLYIYLDSGAGAVIESEKTVVFDNIIFHNNEGPSIQLDETSLSAGAIFSTPVVNDGTISWTYDAKDAGWHNIIIPVENWQPFDKWLHINVTFSHATGFGVYSSTSTGFKDGVHGTYHPVFAAGTYDLWLSTEGTIFASGAANKIYFYCDAITPSEGSLIKTITINSIEFARTATLESSPNGTVVTINYAEGKATYDDTVYEVAKDKDFTQAVASGSAVTPGMKLYVRKLDGTSAVTEIVLPVTVLTEDMVTINVITESVISTASHPGYQFRLGEDGEWKDTLGSWGNLEADTEYTIYVRIKASENGFASETISIKVKTLAASGGGTTDPGKDNKKGCKSSLSLVGVGTAVGALALGTAVVLFARKKKDN